MLQKLVPNPDLTMTKPYLSISEVADRFKVTPDLLRKWERDFPRVLRPRRTQGETRLYDAKAVQQVAVIYRLLRVEGLSIDAARRKLNHPGSLDDAATRQEVVARLQAIRQHLQAIADELII